MCDTTNIVAVRRQMVKIAPTSFGAGRQPHAPAVFTPKNVRGTHFH